LLSLFSDEIDEEKMLRR